MAGKELSGLRSESMHIAEVWEVTEEDANILLQLGWKILLISQRIKSVNEEGWIHSKFVGFGSEIIYVMGRREQIPTRKNSWERASDYKKRLEREVVGVE